MKWISTSRPLFAFFAASVSLAAALSACNSNDTTALTSFPGSFPGVGTGNTSTGTGTGTTVAASPIALDSEELAFVTLINDYRIQNGLPALKLSPTLVASSRWMATDMATKNYLDHTDTLGRDPFVRMDAFGYNTGTGYSGENIAAGNATAEATFTQWKNSPGHNANMLGAHYAAMGVGRADSANSSYGWYWATDFGSSTDK